VEYPAFIPDQAGILPVHERHHKVYYEKKYVGHALIFGKPPQIKTSEEVPDTSSLD